MRTREEILNSYQVTNEQGVPEISAADLLKAMEEYRLEAEQAAFEAGRATVTAPTPPPSYTFATYEDYKASIALTTTTGPDPLAANIQLIADSILEQFLPSDDSVRQISFDIRTDGQTYNVTYQRNEQGYWYFSTFSPLGGQ